MTYCDDENREPNHEKRSEIQLNSKLSSNIIYWILASIVYESNQATNTDLDSQHLTQLWVIFSAVCSMIINYKLLLSWSVLADYIFKNIHFGLWMISNHWAAIMRFRCIYDKNNFVILQRYIAKSLKKFELEEKEEVKCDHCHNLLMSEKSWTGFSSKFVWVLI